MNTARHNRLDAATRTDCVPLTHVAEPAAKRVQQRSGLNLNRRQLLTSAGVIAGGLTARSWASLARGDSPASRLRVGVIGTGVRGKYLIGNLPRSIRVEAICDCATSRMSGTLEPTGEFAKILDSFRLQQAPHCSTHQDYRHMLDRVKLDAVIIATPDHHHVPAALRALQVGLDVYLEKPMTVSVAEGRLLADAVKKTGRVLQVGSQQRSMVMNRYACEFIRDGITGNAGLGKISRVDFPNYPGPMAVPDYPAEPKPPGLEWELFLGPTPSRPHNRRLWVKDDFKVGDLLWRGWDLFEDYSGHLMTNWGAHNIDMVQYALGMDHTGPVRLAPITEITAQELETDWQQQWAEKTPQPTKPWLEDPRFRPVRLEYANGVVVQLIPGIKQATFYGERGRMEISRNKYVCAPADLLTGEPDQQLAAVWNGPGHVARPHLQNWLDCIASRSVPQAPVEVGHRTATVCHLVNIVRKLNRPVQWDPVKERMVDDDEAQLLIDRPRRPGFELPSI